MTVEEKTLKATLAGLGRTGEGVRRKLVKAGAKGVPEDSQSCSIAAYLATTFPGETVEVDDTTIVVNGAIVPTPKGATEFIIGFDDLQYPELLAHHEDCGGVTVTVGSGWNDEQEYDVSCSCGRLLQVFDSRGEASAYARRARRAL